MCKVSGRTLFSFFYAIFHNVLRTTKLQCIKTSLKHNDNAHIPKTEKSFKNKNYFKILIFLFVFRVSCLNFQIEIEKILKRYICTLFYKIAAKKTCTMKKSDTVNTLNTMFYIAISGKCFHLLCHEQNYLFYLTFHWFWLHSFLCKFHKNTIHY